MKKNIHIFFCGSVQGVGFRYTVTKLANELGVTGWVRNISDGRVEAECEGDEGAIKKLISCISKEFEGYLTDTVQEWSSSKCEYTGFEVRR